MQQPQTAACMVSQFCESDALKQLSWGLWLESDTGCNQGVFCGHPSFTGERCVPKLTFKATGQNGSPKGSSQGGSWLPTERVSDQARENAQQESHPLTVTQS
jgi:hypothetical protein